MRTRALIIGSPERQTIAAALSNARDKTVPLAKATRLPAHQSIVKVERKNPPLDEVTIEDGYHCLVWFEEQPVDTGLICCLRIYVESDIPEMLPDKLAVAHLALAFGLLELHCVWIEKWGPQQFAIVLAAKAEKLKPLWA
jgi:hypothetical protein